MVPLRDGGSSSADSARSDDASPADASASDAARDVRAAGQDLGAPALAAADAGPRAGADGVVYWFDQRWVFGVPKPFRPKLAPPVSDWAKPHDFANGTFHIRITVNSKPTDAPVWMEVIFWRGSTHHCLICTDPLDLKKPGTYSCSLPVKSAFGSIKTPTGVSLGWRCASPPVFDRPFDKIEVSAKLPDARGERNPADELSDKDVPLDARMSVVLVPAGKSFPGWGP
jgi:hypothetical protein